MNKDIFDDELLKGKPDCGIPIVLFFSVILGIFLIIGFNLIIKRDIEKMLIEEEINKREW